MCLGILTWLVVNATYRCIVSGGTSLVMHALPTINNEKMLYNQRRKHKKNTDLLCNKSQTSAMVSYPDSGKRTDNQGFLQRKYPVIKSTSYYWFQCILTVIASEVASEKTRQIS
jgi:hypothetical protein